MPEQNSRPHRTRPAQILSGPFQRFIELETGGAILLLIMTIIAVAWANSPWGASYDHFWHTPVTIGFGHAPLTLSLPTTPCQWQAWRVHAFTHGGRRRQVEAAEARQAELDRLITAGLGRLSLDRATLARSARGSPKDGKRVGIILRAAGYKGKAAAAKSTTRGPRAAAGKAT